MQICCSITLRCFAKSYLMTLINISFSFYSDLETLEGQISSIWSYSALQSHFRITTFIVTKLFGSIIYITFPVDCFEDIKENTNKMGNEASLPMEMATNFDAEEIKRLGKRFKKLDLDNSGSLSVDEFMSLPELQQVIYLIKTT